MPSKFHVFHSFYQIWDFIQTLKSKVQNLRFARLSRKWETWVPYVKILSKYGHLSESSFFNFNILYCKKYTNILERSCSFQYCILCNSIEEILPYFAVSIKSVFGKHVTVIVSTDMVWQNSRYFPCYFQMKLSFFQVVFGADLVTYLCSFN